MLIDYLTERYYYSQESLWFSLMIYCVAALVALLLRRRSQAKAAKKYGKEYPPFPMLLLQDLTSGLWAIFFFLLTGCLKGPLREENVAKDPYVNRKIFQRGILTTLCGAVGFLLVYSVLQIFAGHTVIAYLMLFAKALVAAHISLLIFSLLPLPGSDADMLLRKGTPGPKGTAFRRQGTLPFLLYTVICLLMASITLPLSGANYSLSYIATLFPIVLIGG